MTRRYDLAIIGSGPGGYVGALYAARNKLNVCVIEKSDIGGTCLNRGCIPTKALLHCTSVLSEVKNASAFGVNVSGYSTDFSRMASRKNEVVIRLRTGIETLFRSNKIDLLKGQAKLSSADTISIAGGGDIKAKDIIIACGSKVSGLPGITIDQQHVLSSDGALDLKSVPESIVIIGGGVIGCEFAGLFNALGAKVTIVEFLDRIIATQSKEASKKLELIFKKRGIDVITSAKAESIETSPAVKVHISGSRTIQAQKVMVSVGRVPATEGLGLENIGVKLEKNRVITDAHLRTSVNNIYAIGDCVSGPMLAHKASYDGILAVDNILGKPRKADYSSVPNCVWTDPEVASVGLSEDEAKAKYPDARTAKFPYLGSGKAYLMGKSDGFVKIIGNDTGNILGVEIMGYGACEMISEAVLAKTAGLNIKDWAHVIHGHPSLSEMIQEAAHIFCQTPIHSA